jgi:hypothetical protein
VTLRDEERQVREALEKLLARFAPLGITWTEGADPPDLLFQIADRRWAVEVTRLYQGVMFRGRPDSRAAIEEPLMRMCEQIQAEVSAVINREYIIQATGEVGSPSLSEIVRRAVEHIQSGKIEDVVLDNQGRVLIRTIPSPVRVSGIVGIHPLTPNAEGRLVPDVETDVRDALRTRLREKLPILRRMEGYDGKALAIVRRHFLAEPEMVRDILSGEQLSPQDLDQVLFVTEDGQLHFVAELGTPLVPSDLARRLVAHMQRRGRDT